MKHKKKEFGLILFMSLVYLFLYMPIFVIIMYSFNRSGDNLTFQGFTPVSYTHLDVYKRQSG